MRAYCQIISLSVSKSSSPSDKIIGTSFLCFMRSTNQWNLESSVSNNILFFGFSSQFMAWSLALFVDADSSQRTCWRAPGWGPQFWDFSPVLPTGCWRCPLWSVSTWPYGSETRSSPAPRSVWVRVRSGSVQSEKGIFYSETPFRVRVAARW